MMSNKIPDYQRKADPNNKKGKSQDYVDAIRKRFGTKTPIVKDVSKTK